LQNIGLTPTKTTANGSKLHSKNSQAFQKINRQDANDQSSIFLKEDLTTLNPENAESVYGG